MQLEEGALISIDAGHNCWPDTGATGIRQEDDLTKEVVGFLIPKLQGLGYKTKDCTPYNYKFSSVNDSLSYRVQQANASGSVLHLCIHFNVGGGHGVETWICGRGGNAEIFAEQIATEIASLGYTNRGVKVGDLYIPKYTNMPCVLVECAFIDSQEDMAIYNGNNMANAVVKAITNEQSNEQPTEIISNAEVINDWFYVRNAYGDIIPGRVDVGDKIQVLDISYSKQLTLVKYPTSDGSRTEYIKNVPSNIKYFYEYQWQNGSTSETVYQDSGCTQSIGTIYPYEKATPLYRENGILHVAYDTSLGKHTKSGYVKYNGGFSRF